MQSASNRPKMLSPLPLRDTFTLNGISLRQALLRQGGQVLVSVKPVVAAKLALYAAIRAQRITKVALAARLGISESAVRKLADPDHRSHIGRVESALKALGRSLVVEDKAA